MFSHRRLGLAVLSFCLLFIGLGNVSNILAADLQTGLEAYRRGDYTAALAEFEPLAEQGDPTAQFSLGVMYDNGEGVLQDYQTAFKWFERAAKQGDARAQGHLGRMYYNGKGTEEDVVMAYVWFNLAVTQGDDKFGLSQKSRKLAERRMSQTQVNEAQELSRQYYARYVEPFQAGSTVASQPPPAPTTSTSATNTAEAVIRTALTTPISTTDPGTPGSSTASTEALDTTESAQTSTPTSSIAETVAAVEDLDATGNTVPSTTIPLTLPSADTASDSGNMANDTPTSVALPTEDAGAVATITRPQPVSPLPVSGTGTTTLRLPNTPSASPPPASPGGNESVMTPGDSLTTSETSASIAALDTATSSEQDRPQPSGASEASPPRTASTEDNPEASRPIQQAALTPPAEAISSIPKPADKPATATTPGSPAPQPSAPAQVKPSPDGGFRIQVASLARQSRTEATSAGERLQQRFDKLLGTLSLDVITADLDKGTFHRIQLGPLSYRQAQQVCRSLQQANQSCFVINR